MRAAKPPSLDFDIFPPFTGFPKEGIAFLRNLRKNNNREWFAKHKGEYEEYVKLPMQSLIQALQGPMRTIAPEVVVDPKKNMFRIYRDTRFSKNKLPYKTHVAAVFPVPGRWEESACLYLHIEPGEVFLGGGIYMPDGQQLKLIRAAIASRPGEFLGIVNDRVFKRKFDGLEGEKLLRNPLGYPQDHPMIEWLKYKQFFTSCTWSEAECLSGRFAEKAAGLFRHTMPLVRFLNAAIGK
jgi:uncharacterized protein (TIGR02453 family)